MGPPPDATPSGAQRLDALIGTTNGKSNGVHHTPASKKVSFAAASEEPEDNETLSRLEKYEKDPNAFISEAESLLNSSTIEKMNMSTGHTPSVIGAQEIYRDPRMKMMQQKAEAEKSMSKSNRDGAKLSFQ